MSSVGTISLPSLTVGSNGQVSVSNLVNNLDPTAIVNALMTAEAIPQTQLQAKVKTEQTALSAFQNLNATLQALQTSAAGAAATNGLNLLTVSSSDSSVTASATTSASPTSFSLQVDQIAQAQVSVTGAMTTWPDAGGAITIVDSTGTAHGITAASSSISDVVAAINAAGVGVTAAQVASGTDASGNPQYRLQLTSTQTGAAAAFQVYAGTSAAYTAGTATNLLTQPGAATVTAAQDAQVTLWPGTAAAQTVSSATDTFADLVQGVAVTVTKPTTTPVTLTSKMDSTSIASTASSLISGVNTLLSYISQQSAVSTTQNTDGSSTTTTGTFTGSLLIQEVYRGLQSAVSAPVGPGGTISPATYGIAIQSDGSIKFDSAKFQAALASDPSGTIAAVQTIASRVQAASATASDPVTGTVTASISSQQTQISNDQSSVSNWTTMLAAKRKLLTAQYTALVTTLGQLQNEQNYLTQQINAMNPSSNN
ncbi:flagellar filament capping protein FliD [Leifsonia shinshuensis]|uniref:Flagellar hook-associated protein 2 n=1 Tax=Leifsonia shinshuensis TaxID=150026 RepID=A0A7G6YCP1_9MICO|nr:flagellar filament capping protein FliD [Leifsonia shinshuensis]QNE36256.1 flagellar filament capping protein FliD [Leifsonia shinshuensis]